MRQQKDGRDQPKTRGCPFVGGSRLQALFTGDGICIAAVHDDSACSSTRFLENLARNEDRRSVECIEGETRSDRSGVR